MKKCILLLGIVMLAGCASIPPESIVLSQEIGTSIKQQYESQINLVELYFKQKRKLIDEGFRNSLSVRADTIAAGVVGQELSEAQIGMILSNMKDSTLTRMAEHQKVQQELDASKAYLLSELQSNYLEISKANTTITALLQSAVDVKKATSEVYSKIYEASDGKVDIAGMLDLADQVIAEHGNKAGEALDLLNKLKEHIEKD